MANRTKATPNKKAQFIEQLQRDSNVSRSCEAVKLARSTVYDWKRNDPDFSAQWDSAIEQGTDALEDEAVRRGMKYSDTLLIFLLKGRRPQKYGTTRQEVAGPDGGAINVHLSPVVFLPAVTQDDDDAGSQ